MSAVARITVVVLGMLLLSAVGGSLAQDGRQSLPAIEPRGADGLPPALLDDPEADSPVRPTLPAPLRPVLGRPIRLADSLRESLRNVETVQANLAVRTATVAQFEALKAFVPLMNMPQTQVGFSRVTGPVNGQNVLFPDITGGVPLVGQPGLDHAEVNRFNIFLPLDPSGHITALPIAEEGIRAKELMEQLVRRSQAVLGGPALFRGQADRLRPARPTPARTSRGKTLGSSNASSANSRRTTSRSARPASISGVPQSCWPTWRKPSESPSDGWASRCTSAVCWCRRSWARRRSSRRPHSASTWRTRTRSTWAWSRTSHVLARRR